MDPARKPPAAASSVVAVLTAEDQARLDKSRKDSPEELVSHERVQAELEARRALEACKRAAG